MHRRMITLALGAVVALAACGGGDGGKGAGGECTASETNLCISAEGIAFDTEKLTAPADQAFTLNVSIYADDTAADALFTGETFGGPDQRVYDVPALAAGDYFFRCDVHPSQMT